MGVLVVLGKFVLPDWLLFVDDEGVELGLFASEFVDFIIDALPLGVDEFVFIFELFTAVGERGGSIGNALAKADIVDI